MERNNQKERQEEYGAGCKATFDVGPGAGSTQVVCRLTHVFAKILPAQRPHRQNVLVAGQRRHDVILVRPQNVAVP